MSSVELVSLLAPHPNADRLELCTVLGWCCVVHKDSLHVGDKVILIRTDYKLPPEAKWAEPFRKASTPRIRAMKLRGVVSKGIVLSLQKFREDFPEVFTEEGEEKKALAEDFFQEGVELDTWLQVKKYESPPIHPKGGPNVPHEKGPLSSMFLSDILPYKLPKTDQLRYESLRKKNPNRCAEGTLVDITQKIDGTSVSFGHLLSNNWLCKKTDTYMKEDPPLEAGTELSFRGRGELIFLQTFITTRTHVVNPDEKSVYVEQSIPIIPKLIAYCEKHGVSLRLEGELHGGDIQNIPINPHRGLPVTWKMFAVFDMGKMAYCHKGSPHYFVTVARELGIPMVDLLEENVPFSVHKVAKYTSVLTKINDKLYEGAVFQHEKGSFKVLNDEYDMKK